MGGSVGVITAYRAGARREQRGFSLIELLVTVTLAGIIFVAMVPMFVSVLKGTSTNERRVIATNLSQARLEDARMLGYANLSATSLQSNFGDDLHGSPRRRHLQHHLLGDARTDQLGHAHPRLQAGDGEHQPRGRELPRRSAPSSRTPPS